MRGNKWQLFKMDLSFTLYMIMDIATYGLLGVLVFNPYYAATIVEFYSFVKEKYIDNKCERYELLNDKYLLENKKDLECYPGVTRKEKKKMEEKKGKKEGRKKWKKGLTVCLSFLAGAGLAGWVVYKHKDVIAAVLEGSKLPKGTKMSTRIGVKFARTAVTTVQDFCTAVLNKVKGLFQAKAA